MSYPDLTTAWRNFEAAAAALVRELSNAFGPSDRTEPVVDFAECIRRAHFGERAIVTRLRRAPPHAPRPPLEVLSNHDPGAPWARAMRQWKS